MGMEKVRASCHTQGGGLMDTTAVYLRMCRLAYPYLKWKKEVGNFWVKGGPSEEEKGEVMMITDAFDLTNVDFVRHSAFPLYSQSDLQKRYRDFLVSWQTALIRFMDWTKRPKKESYIAFDMHIPNHINSMEQFWLAFLMWDNFRMRWDGTEWVAI